MEKYLRMPFTDEEGVTCEHCMLSFSKGERSHCAALGIRPFCPEKGRRKDCPLKTLKELGIPLTD